MPYHKVAVEVVALQVKSDEGAVPPGEGDLVVCSFPPVGHLGVAGHVAEGHHVVDLSPPEIAYRNTLSPSVPVRVILGVD